MGNPRLIVHYSPAQMNRQSNLRIGGQVTSPGMVIGPAFVYHDHPDALSPPRTIKKHQIEKEMSDVERAVKIVREDLKISAQRIEAQTGPKLAAIFDAHEEMLQDSSLRREIRDEVEGTLINASQALARVFLRWEEKFRATGEEMLQERADDLVDLQGRLLREIAGVKTTVLEKMPPARILVARRLFPSDTVALPRRGVLGIVLEFGGPGSHAALLARALGIPTVVLIPNATGRIGGDRGCHCWRNNPLPGCPNTTALRELHPKNTGRDASIETRVS